ncbi:unnamed protein product [Spirodela intermedia]|uniref:Uncharacterized protein n=1 Tax=Spirodela intermedia TaxID=51605 RepID=A0A7I8L8U9_SPIIN|nr:unnamed protein product [Spirodela intermedia]
MRVVHHDPLRDLSLSIHRSFPLLYFNQPSRPLTVNPVPEPLLAKVTVYCFFSPEENVRVAGRTVADTGPNSGFRAMQVVPRGPKLVSTRPASTAPLASTSPAPMSKRDAGFPTWSSIRFPALPTWLAEVISDDLIAPASGVPTGVGHAARMLTPGATMSGFNIPGLEMLGPLEEKYATAGVNCPPVTVPLKTMVAVGLLPDVMYCFIANPT